LDLTFQIPRTVQRDNPAAFNYAGLRRTFAQYPGRIWGVAKTALAISLAPWIGEHC